MYDHNRVIASFRTLLCLLYTDTKHSLANGSPSPFNIYIYICTTPSKYFVTSFLTKDLPTPRPLALKKVKIMPPPRRMTSHFSIRDSITVICSSNNNSK